jgi:hypothetical protein
MLDADRLEGGLAQVVYLVVLMIAPVLGASAVAYSQARHQRKNANTCSFLTCFGQQLGLSVYCCF